MRTLLDHHASSRGRRAVLTVAAAAALTAALPARDAAAAAFSIYEQSPAGTAMAGAMTARADDASTIFYNPAGLGFLSGLSVVANATIITAKSSATDMAGTTYDSQRGNFLVPALYAAARVHDRVSIGVGGFASYGLGVDWKVDGAPAFPGRFKVQDASLQTFTVNPTVAIRLLPMISIAVGFDAVRGSVGLTRSLALGQDEAQVSLSAGTWAYGGNVGLMLSLIPGKLSAGFAYRSYVDLKFDGGTVGYTPAAGVSGSFPYTTGGAAIELPHTYAVGLSARPWSFFGFSVDLNALQWSSTRELRLTLSDPTTNASQVSVTPRNWHETITVRVGLESDLSQFAPRRFVPKVRLGFAFDQSPVPAETLDPSLPDGNRYLVSGGLSLGLRHVGAIELAYMAVFPESRTSANPDLPLKYSTSAHVFSAGLVIQLDNLLGKRSAPYARGLLSQDL